MRSKRTDRRELKRALARLEEENAALRRRLTENAADEIAVPAPADGDALSETAAAAESFPPVPALSAGGYPTRASPRTVKTLREAKEILLSTPKW